MSDKKTILIVDDDEVVRNMLGKLLQIFDYNIVSCSNGGEAVEYYKEHWKEISLIILDKSMPVMDGRESLLLLKDINPDIKAIISSGYNTLSGFNDILDSNNLGFIEKPFKLDALKLEVSRMLTV